MQTRVARIAPAARKIVDHGEDVGRMRITRRIRLAFHWSVLYNNISGGFRGGSQGAMDPPFLAICPVINLRVYSVNI